MGILRKTLIVSLVFAVGLIVVAYDSKDFQSLNIDKLISTSAEVQLTNNNTQVNRSEIIILKDLIPKDIVSLYSIKSENESKEENQSLVTKVDKEDSNNQNNDNEKNDNLKPVVSKPSSKHKITDNGRNQKVIDSKSSNKVIGIDISHYQSDRGEIDWKKVKDSKVSFAFIKVSEGSTYKDPFAKKHFDGAKEQGIKAGGYHFARPEQPVETDAKKEVAHFISRLKIADNNYGSLPAVLDLEDPLYKGTNNLSTNDLLKWAKIFCEEFEKNTNHKIIIYTGTWFMNQWDNFNSEKNPLNKYSLWLANYYKINNIGGGWNNYLVWQFTDKGQVPGITGDVDLNIADKTLLTYCN